VFNFVDGRPHSTRFADMPLTMGEWGEPEAEGLLMNGDFGEAVRHLPEYDLSEVKDPALLMALFRDYTCAYFLAFYPE
jgi:hypothetical protein